MGKNTINFDENQNTYLIGDGYGDGYGDGDGDGY